MGKTYNYLAVDGNKLRAEITKRGISIEAFSRELGHTDSFIYHICRQGRMKESALKPMTTLFGIKYDHIKPDDVEPEKAVEEPVNALDPAVDVVGIDYAKLGDVIYEAVYQAVKKAWAE